MIKFIEAKKNYIMALAIFFVIVSLSGTTYSLFIKSDTTNTFNYNTGILDLEFTEDEQITLESAFPKYDSEGVKQTPYTLTIKNTGSLTYQFDLKMLSSDSDNVIDNKYIKVKVNDELPHTLFATNNVIASNLIIYPGQELTFKIYIWLDIDTPNNELGKKFIARVVSSGSAIYKTLDSSGANRPDLKDNMLPIYYDEVTKSWKKADSSNTNETYRWYDYDKSMWANTVVLNDSHKQIYDLTRNNNLTIDNPKINNGNLIIDENYLDIGLSNYNYDKISTILRLKVNKITDDKIYFISNNKFSYYYDNQTHKFIYTDGYTIVASSEYTISENTWYILGYTYDESTVKFYVNGNLISTATIYSTLNDNNTFKVGTDMTNSQISNLTVGDIYIYNTVLEEQSINNNYKTSINVIYDNLIAGYDEFTPMTIKEYYLSKPVGTKINNEDVNSYFVWIPRFKYKLWNATGENNIDTYNAYQIGIDIVFEKDNTSSGVIYCENLECYSDELKITKITQNDNGKYYTHPAFKNLDEELSGIWVSKYEVSNNNQTIESKTNNEVWTNNYLSSFYQSIKKLGNNYSMIKNTEWGAITYLSHSKYGVCQNNNCQSITPNTTYISGNNLYDTTTGNIYGVYDMAGSATEFTMSNYTDNPNELSLTNSNFQNTPISNNDYNLYYNNGFILGDATKELSLESGIWYNSANNFINSTNNWLARGGIAKNEFASIYSYNATTDITSEYITTRMIIK
ncbi:MAG: LamG-like jellyroll fold domain-containing protein [Bacilli bacterium]